MPVQLLERIVEHEIEPELLRPIPRRLRVTYWSTFAFAATVIGMFIVGIGVICIAVQSSRMLWLSEHGRTAVATISNCTFVDGRTGACSTHPTDITNLNFEFTADNSVYSSSTIYDAIRDHIDFTSKAKSSQILLVRYGTLAGHLISCPASSLSSKAELTMVVVDMVVGLVCAYFILTWLYWNTRKRMLVKYGIPVVGTIKDKTITDDDGPRYFVTVGYLDSDGLPHQFLERCTPDQWRRLDIGQPVTALSLKPGRGVCEIYDHMPLRCA